MLPAHQRPLGRRAHQAQQHPQHAAAGGQYYAPPSEPQQQPPHDDDRSGSRRRRLPFGRQRLRRAQGALLLLVLPMLVFAAVLYKRSRGGGEVQQPQSLAVGTRNLAKPHKPLAAARPVKLQLSTFGKNETGKGETAQVWLTLANEEDTVAGADAAADVALQVG
jgi:hypothetical protein